MKDVSVFISYNPKNDFEQTLAVRLHTIGAVHGFNMLMPERFYGSSRMSSETAFRIKSSDYFILFSTSKLTPIVQEEIGEAFKHLKDKSKIIIIYDRVKNISHNQNCTEIIIDTSKNNVQEIIEKVVSDIKRNEIRKSANKNDPDTSTILGGILLVGLGLLALDSILTSKK